MRTKIMSIVGDIFVGLLMLALCSALLYSIFWFMSKTVELFV